MNWENLKILLAISRCGSLTAAAHELDMDQSTVGRRLNALEADLGMILFVRSKSGFVSTDAGLAALARAREIEQCTDALYDQLTEFESGASGLVRLVGNPWTLGRLAALGIPGLLADNPRLKIHLQTALPPTPVRGDATISLWFEAPSNPSEFTTSLGKVPYAVYRSVRSDPSDNRWVGFQDDMAQRPVIDRATRAIIGEDCDNTLTATDAGLLLAAVKGGMGKGLLPMCLGEDDPGLRRVGKGAPDLERVIHMHLNPDTLETKRVRSTVQWLRDNFKHMFACPV